MANKLAASKSSREINQLSTCNKIESRLFGGGGGGGGGGGTLEDLMEIDYLQSILPHAGKHLLQHIPFHHRH